MSNSRDIKPRELILRLLVGAISLVVLVAVFAGSSWAGSSYSYYSTTAGKFGEYGYSDYQTKAVSGANGTLKSGTVGTTSADYLVDVRMNSDKGNGRWLRNVDDGTIADIPGNYKQTAGTRVNLQFSSDWWTPVNLQVTGNWRSR